MIKNTSIVLQISPKQKIGSSGNVVVNYYLVGLYFKFHEDLCIIVRAQVVNACAQVLLRLRAFTTRAHTFMHKS